MEENAADKIEEITELNKYDLNDQTLKPIYSEEFPVKLKSFSFDNIIPQVYFPENAR
jgi:hypothetical protein